MTDARSGNEASQVDLQEAAILALDPGRNLGAAWLDEDGAVVELAVLAVEHVEGLPLPLNGVVLVGNGTGSAALMERLGQRGVEPLLVDERHTTLIARELYFRDHPARGLARWLPNGLRSPPRPIDDYAAYAIALRWLEQQR